MADESSFKEANKKGDFNPLIYWKSSEGLVLSQLKKELKKEKML